MCIDTRTISAFSIVTGKFGKTRHNCKDEHSRTYEDHLCFFRCLAIGKFGKTIHNCNCKAKELFNRYCEHFQVTPEEFKGIELEDFCTLENFYEVQLLP